MRHVPHAEVDPPTGPERLAAGLALRGLRQARGVSQEGWAALLGVGARTVQRWESGAAVPDAHAEQALLAVCRAPEELSRLLAAARLESSQRSPPARQTNLPAPLTGLIGRQRDLAEVKRLLGATRLVTLTGAGGVGKTRLALQTAAEVRDAYPDGAWWVELATLADAATVERAVAAVLGVHEWPDQPLRQSLHTALRSSQLLLILDNCEHLVEACARLAEDLLQACPGTCVLATSREPLRVGGESIWRVPSLQVPQGERPPRLAELREYAGVRLFLDRAAAAQPGFRLTDQNASAVSQICQRLDGIPLALELAAARVRGLSVEQVAGRLDDCFRLLTSGSRTALPRQQTLRATIDWSHGLLSETERVFFRRLAVFLGGFTLESAEAVCAGQGIEPATVLDLLTLLVDRSLVTLEESAAAGRYRLLEPLRRYAEDELRAAGEEASLRERHRMWFLRLAEAAEPELRGANQAVWLARLEQEHANFRAAFAWSLEERPHSGKLQRLAAALAWFWYMHGHLVEGRGWLEHALAARGRVPSRVRIKLLHGAARLVDQQGQHGQAAALLEESLRLARELGDSWSIAWSLLELGFVAWNQGNYPRATICLEESVTLLRELGESWALSKALAYLGNVARARTEYARAAAFCREGLTLRRELGDRHGIILSLGNLGIVAREEGKPAEAAALLQESLNLARELADSWSTSWLLHNLGNVADDVGDLPRATSLHAQSLRLFRAMGDERGVGWALAGLAVVAQHQGNYERATALLRESVVLRRKQGDKRAIAQLLERFAEVACARGATRRAARLFGAADSLREAIGAPRMPAERADYERQTTAMRLGPEADCLTSACAEGRALALEEAVAFALEQPEFRAVAAPS